MRYWLLLTAAALAPVWAAEQAVLSNGFRIRADRHESVDGKIRLLTATGAIELEPGEVVRFEPDEPVFAAPTPVLVQPAGATMPPPPADPNTLINQAAARHGLPPALIHSVARAESGYRMDAISPKGAIGVMQLMPGTAATLEADPFDAAQNIDAGTRLLRDLLLRYEGSARKALAAYNAGAGAVDRYRGEPPYRETQLYVDRVLRDYLRRTASGSTNSPTFE